MGSVAKRRIKTAPKSRSGSTIPDAERARRGYGKVTISLPFATQELYRRVASRHGTTFSGALVLALGALIEVEGLPK